MHTVRVSGLIKPTLRKGPSHRDTLEPGARIGPAGICAGREQEVTVCKLIERIKTPGGEKRVRVRLKLAIAAQHGARTGKRWLIRCAMLR